MAYETGTAVDIDDLIDTKLKTFAVAAGWNVNDDNWPDHLALSKGGCFASLRRYTPAPFNDAFSVSRTDHRVWGALASGYDGAGGTPAARWIGQPDNLITSSTVVGLAVQSNDLLGPFTSYHLFSGAVGDRDYIYLVAEADAGFFTHVYFGVVDDLGLAFDPPVAFMTATYWAWWPTSTTETTDVSNEWGLSSHLTPFNLSNQHVYSEGPEPSRKMTRAELAAVYSKDNLGYVNDDWMDHLFALGPNSLNGITPLMPIPILLRNFTTSTIHHYCGVLPNIRLCSIKGRVPKEEIVLGGDTWMVFPMRKQGSVTEEPRLPSPAITNTSWKAGFAIKKVV